MNSTLDTMLRMIAASIALRGNPTDPELGATYHARLREVQSCGPHVPAAELKAALGLSDAELGVLWLMAAVALRRDARDAVATVTLDEASADLGVSELQALLGADEVHALSALLVLSETAPLRRFQLIESTAGGVHEMRQSWTVSRRVLLWLHGDRSVDARLDGIAQQVEAAPLLEDIETNREHVRSAIKSKALLVFSGSRGNGRRSQLRTAALREGVKLMEIDCAALAPKASELRDQAIVAARECRLLGCVPLLRNIDALDTAEQLPACLTIFERNIDGPVFATCGVNKPAMRWSRPSIVVDVKAPTSAQRAKLWLDGLEQGTVDDAEYLATLYPIAPALIHHAASAAKARANGRKMLPEDIYAGVRAVLDDKLGDYAKRVEVTQSWDDLVLPEDEMEAIQYLIARIRQRRTVYEQWGFAGKIGKGLGTSALFSGPPGTGKTMVAALIAKELGLELYQVDMAKITSKYIGETERNLAALFDAAEAGHAILLFDEADSLFGKRTDVKSSNDRYANLETNYLLQRLESFTGICLLTSNHESNIDPAFQRRLSLHLRFELPEIEEREALWRAMLPTAAPVAGNVDFMSLARRFVMSGGYIRNAALRAAFLAADEGSVITAPHLERAAKLEYEGMGKIAA